MSSDDRIVTEVRSAEGKFGRVSVYLDGELAATIHPTAAKRLRLAEGKRAPADLAERAAQEEESAALEYALRLLGRQDRTVAELTDRLERRAFAPGPIEAAIARLVRNGYLDDAKLADRLVRDRLTRRPHGRRAIEWTLRRKRVPEGIINASLEKHFEGVDETKVAADLARTRLERLRGLDEEKLRRRLFAFLARRGFDSEAIRGALTEVLPDAEG